jgi:hypothetical protein
MSTTEKLYANPAESMQRVPYVMGQTVLAVKRGWTFSVDSREGSIELPVGQPVELIDRYSTGAEVKHRVVNNGDGTATVTTDGGRKWWGGKKPPVIIRQSVS